MSSYRGGYIWRNDRALIGLNAQIMAARPAWDKPMVARGGSDPRSPCGTASANRRHRRRGEPVCEACAEAERRRGRRYRARRAA